MLSNVSLYHNISNFSFPIFRDMIYNITIKMQLYRRLKMFYDQDLRSVTILFGVKFTIKYFVSTKTKLNQISKTNIFFSEN